MATESSLRADLQTAMKARDMPAVYVLRGVLAAVANLRIEKRVEAVGEQDVATVLQREAKKRDEAARFAREANRMEVVEQNEVERAVLERYLPRQLSEDDLRGLFHAWLDEGAGGIGALMARLKSEHPGEYDGKRASTIARDLMTSR